MGMITAPPATKLIAGEELLVMGNIGPCELIDGRIVPMSPTGGEHGILESELGRHLGNVVLVYRSSIKVQVFGGEDTLNGEGVLEGFELPVASLFVE